jgi:hypothetical protein
MFIRDVGMELRDNSALEFTFLINADLLPLLRKEPGGRDEVTFITLEGLQAVAISFWDSKENAETFNNTDYQEVLKRLSKVVRGTPEIKTFELSSSTFHKIAAKGT